MLVWRLECFVFWCGFFCHPGNDWFGRAPVEIEAGVWGRRL